MSDTENLMNRLNELQQSASNLFAAIDLEKGKLPFEISPECTQHMNCWYHADDFAKFLGNGWRLPTRDEVPLLRNFFEFGVSFNDYVWTSETIDEDLYDDFNAWAVHTKTGKSKECELLEQHAVVLVRDRSND